MHSAAHLKNGAGMSSAPSEMDAGTTGYSVHYPPLDSPECAVLQVLLRILIPAPSVQEQIHRGAGMVLVAIHP